MPRATLSRSISMLFAASLLFAPGALIGAPIIDPLGDFIDVYTGPENADLDVLRAEVFLDPAAGDLIFTSTSAGNIGITPTGIFVWGINRGAGFVDFAGIGLPDIKFDAVLVVTAGGAGFVMTLDNGLQTNLQASDITISGPDISARASLSLFPSLGFAPSDYTVNLWPRSLPIIDRVDVISDFAPDATNAAVTVVPEPATLGLVSLTVAGFVLARARRRR
jgi:PEP-CTERM motif